MRDVHGRRERDDDELNEPEAERQDEDRRQREDEPPWKNARSSSLAMGARSESVREWDGEGDRMARAPTDKGSRLGLLVGRGGRQGRRAGEGRLAPPRTASAIDVVNARSALSQAFFSVAVETEAQALPIVS